MTIPVYSLILEKYRKKYYLYMISLALVTISVLPLCFKIIGVDYNSDLVTNIVGGYSVYVLIGYLLNKYEWKKKQTYLIYFFAIIGFIVHFLGTWYLSFKTGHINQLFKGYTNIPTVVYSIGIFCMFKNLIKIDNKKVIKLFEKISEKTFGIYLVHIYIIKGAEKILNIDNSSIIYRILAPVIIFVIAYCGVAIMKKIPILKRVV